MIQLQRTGVVTNLARVPGLTSVMKRDVTESFAKNPGLTRDGYPGAAPLITESGFPTPLSPLIRGQGCF